MKKTCQDCLLKNENEEKDGYCYMWKKWAENKICSEFRLKK